MHTKIIVFEMLRHAPEIKPWNRILCSQNIEQNPRNWPQITIFWTYIYISILHSVRAGVSSIAPRARHSMFKLRKAAQRLCRKSGIAPAANFKPGKHLQLDHPAIVRVQTWIALQVAMKRFHPQLVANFDQTWSLNAVPRRKTLQVATRRVSEPASKQKVRHRLEVALGLDPTIVEPPDTKPGIAGGMAANVAIEGWRVPHTLTTLSWIDGTVGRGFITARGDHLPVSTREKLNKDKQGDTLSVQ